ncbi:hypothetical protein SAY86_028086 [Trapa natans]|uniref:TF-B3 domain-containing protein n=1 Tax=Trapa natans TaxID=22666 RepID=A0AAN7MEZ7_TRANT|nr:hypothetical protein SAY86_028086 [Trapa natans]
MDPYSYSSSFHSHHHTAALTSIPPPLNSSTNDSNALSVSPLLSTLFDHDDDHLNSRSAEEESGAGLPTFWSGGGSGSFYVAEIEKEHMFDKVVTPSDVGKLNRLVIPKQHAEKYFPLDSSANEKELLLNFEDINGRPWRFRYSYWNSSQSYVMTKGWSRFVKEKKLDAGDIVSFQRGVGETGKDRLFIDSRRRLDRYCHPPGLAHNGLFPSTGVPHPYTLQHSTGIIDPRTRTSFFGGSTGVNYGDVVNVATPCRGGSSLFYLSRSGLAMAPPPTPSQMGVQEIGGGNNIGAKPSIQIDLGSVPVVQRKAAGKRLRLFGVNMDCPISDSGEDHQDCEVLSSTWISHAMTVGAQPSASSRSLAQNPQLRSRLYNGMPLMSKSKDDSSSSSSSMPLDLDINLRVRRLQRADFPWMSCKKHFQRFNCF